MIFYGALDENFTAIFGQYFDCDYETLITGF